MPMSPIDKFWVWATDGIPFSDRSANNSLIPKRWHGWSGGNQAKCHSSEYTRHRSYHAPWLVIKPHKSTFDRRTQWEKFFKDVAAPFLRLDIMGTLGENLNL